MLNFFKKCFLLFKGCDEIVNGYPVIRDKDNPAICYVTNPIMNTWAFWDKNHPNYKSRISEILKRFR